MLEKPDLKDEKIMACLLNEYGLNVVQIVFLPLGADLNTAVYHAITAEKMLYFVKIRQGDFDESSLSVPKYLSGLGIKQIIPSLTTRTGQLYANLDTVKVILYPFVEGHNGFEVNLSAQHWVEFGKALKSLHSAVIPPSLTRSIRREEYTPKWREMVRSFLERIRDETFDEPTAAELADFLAAKHDDTLELAARSEQLAASLQVQNPEFILCHADIHAGNLLIDNSDNLYIVDWDTLCFAPKERDLMFVGAGLGGNGHTPQEEVFLFYRGYGPAHIDPIALAYYRYERIVEDIAVFCQQIFSSDEGGDDRKQSLEYLKSNYLPNHTIEIAYQSDITSRDG
jgi:spectinomycin phosphotransferase